MKQLPITENKKVGLTNDMIGGGRIGNIRIIANFTGNGVAQNEPSGNYVAARKDGKGRLIISPYKALHAMRQDERPSANPKYMAPMTPLANIPEELLASQVRTLASMDYLTNGYMQMLNGANIYTKQKVFTMGHLVQTNANPSVRVTQISSGPRTNALKEELAKNGGVMLTEKGDVAASNNYNKRDVVSETTYSSDITIAIPDVAFISCDDMHGRCAMSPEYLDLYCAELEKTLGSPVHIGYYRKANCPDIFGEYGILLTDEQILVILNHLFANLQRIFIHNSTAYAEYESAIIELYEASIAHRRDIKTKLEFDCNEEFFVEEGTHFETGYVPVTDAETLIAKRKEFLDCAMAANKAKKPKAGAGGESDAE